MNIEVLAVCAFSIAVLLLNLWTMKRAERVEERIKAHLLGGQMLCPLCGDHLTSSDCSTRRM